MAVVIVAIPEEDDRVWKVSSEKVPHMTLLFLGDVTENLPAMADYLEHVASTSLRRFGMMVDRRGELGPDNADVLFFDHDSNTKMLEQVRGFLLQDNNIRTAHDNAPQFEGWIPHLTLGFPDAPAHDDAIDHRIGWVSFDRIALWVTDSDGPTFLLKREDFGVDVAMSDRLSKFISHHGVKGMKWGVRKRSSGGGSSKTRTTFKKPPSKLSTEELKKRINRMEIEKKYNDLNSPDMSSGRRFVSDVLNNSGRRVVNTVATGATLLVVKTALEAKFGSGVGEAVTRRLK